MTRFISATYHPRLKVAEFIADDGRHMIRSGGSLPWRTNNIGNLASPISNGAPAPRKTRGYIGFAKPENSNLHFFIFPDYDTGRSELKTTILRRHKDKKIAQFVAAYAPQHDGNDVAGYTRKISALTGIESDCTINDLSEAQLESLVDSIARLEGYHAESESRKEVWVNVSHIHATDGARPKAGEEIVLRNNNREVVLKSNTVGQFKAIPHAKTPTEVLRKNADGTLKKIAELPPEKGQTWNLLIKLSEFFGTTAPVKPPTDVPNRKQPTKYTVQPGDSLSKIAKRFNTPVKDIKNFNRLTRDVIWPGQTLGIFEPPANPGPQDMKGATAKVVGAKKPVAATQARSKKGVGEPLALFKLTQQTAPWMTVALREVSVYSGKEEKDISKTHNYHRLVTESDRTGGKVIQKKGKNGKPIFDENGHVLTKTKFDGASSLASTPWCASFVNYCLVETQYPPGRRHMSSYTFGEDKDIFTRVKKPIYGSIRFSSRTGGGHVCLVYGRIGEKLLILGGNQSDQICFQLRDQEESATYYVPTSYIKHAEAQQKEALPEISIEDLRKTYGAAVLITDAQINAQKTAKGSES